MKRKVMVVSLMIAISSTAVAANTCDSITEINALYRSVAEKKATDIQIKRLQQEVGVVADGKCCLLYTSPSPRDRQKSRMPSSA